MACAMCDLFELEVLVVLKNVMKPKGVLGSKTTFTDQKGFHATPYDRVHGPYLALLGSFVWSVRVWGQLQVGVPRIRLRFRTPSVNALLLRVYITRLFSCETLN